MNEEGFRDIILIIIRIGNIGETFKTAFYHLLKPVKCFVCFVKHWSKSKSEPLSLWFFSVTWNCFRTPSPVCDIFEGFPNVSVHCTILLNVDLTELYIFYCLLIKKHNAF